MEFCSITYFGHIMVNGQWSAMTAHHETCAHTTDGIKLKATTGTSCATCMTMHGSPNMPCTACRVHIVITDTIYNTANANN